MPETMKQEKLIYCPPEWEELPVLPGSMLCQSVDNGSIEDITIEDWNMN